MNKGHYMGGIRSLSDLKDRCRVCDETGCWLWAQCMTNGAPKVWLTDKQGTTSMRGRRAAISLLNGERLPSNLTTFPAACCKSSECVNPEHVRVGDRKKAGAALAKSGRLKGVPTKTIAAKKTAAKLRKLTDEAVADIRSSGDSLAVLSARHGVAQNTIWVCRIGRSYKQAGASAFTWRP